MVDLARKPEKTNKWQRKVLTSDVTTEGPVAELTFNSLVVGKVYEMILQARIFESATSGVSARIQHNGVDYGEVTSNDGDTGNTQVHIGSVTTMFTAVTTTAGIFVSSADATSRIEGDGSLRETWVILRERNDFEPETTDFT